MFTNYTEYYRFSSKLSTYWSDILDLLFIMPKTSLVDISNNPAFHFFQLYFLNTNK